MTDISPQADTNDPQDEEEEELEDLLPDIFVENNTGLLYEVKFFDKFVLVRPAAPAFYLAIKKMPLIKFAADFSEFLGDRDEVRAIIRGAPIEFTIEKKDD